MYASIQQLPSRYEPLVSMLGENAQTTFMRIEADLGAMARLLHQAQAAHQGKFQFIYSPLKAGTGKTTFVQSLKIFLPDMIESVHKIDQQAEDVFRSILQYLKNLKVNARANVVNLDGHESFIASDAEYRSFLVQLNTILRNRRDIIILWPTNDIKFAEKIVGILREVGGNSPFGQNPIYNLQGPQKGDFPKILEGILKVANWRLEDAALNWNQVAQITSGVSNIGEYLDKVQVAVTENFRIENIGFEPPKLFFVVSAGTEHIRDICRTLRRADSYYIDSARLQMYTRKSKIARWWDERNKDQKTSLPYIVSLFDAQLLSLSPSSVVHSVLMADLKDFPGVAERVTKNAGNAGRVISSTEFFKFSKGQEVDVKETKASTKSETLEAYEIIQERSKDRHKALNGSILRLAQQAGCGFTDIALEQSYGKVARVGVDAIANLNGEKCHLEFFHKSAGEAKENKIAIYILEKLREYAVGYGVATP
jgi:hypothetical protein